MTDRDAFTRDGETFGGWNGALLPSWLVDWLAPFNAEARARRLTEMADALALARPKAGGVEAATDAIIKAFDAMKPIGGSVPPKIFRNEARTFAIAALSAAAPEPIRVAEPVSNSYKLAGEEVERLRDRIGYWLEAGRKFGYITVGPGDDEAIRSVLALIDARPPTSEEVEKAAAWIEETVADYCDPDSAFRAAELLRRLALIEPSAGKELGADPSQLQPAESGTGPLPHANKEAVGDWRCTRCGRDEIDARANGCTRGPCPMVPR